MAQPILNRPRVVALIGQSITAGVPQHVDMNLERKAGAGADALDEAIDGIGGEWSATLGLEDLAAAGLALQLTQGAQLVATNWMRRRLAILGASNVQGGCDQGRVTVPIAAPAGSPDKRFHLRWRQILTRAQFAVAGPRRSPAPCAN